MICVWLLAFICLYFMGVAIYVKRKPVAEKSKNIARVLSIITITAPIIAAVIFAILFSFVLKGRFTERLAHAITVFSMWICALQFYKYVISYFKNKKVLCLSVVGVILSVATAILLTPLDRFGNIVYMHLPNAAFPFSVCVLIFIYTVTICKDNI